MSRVPDKTELNCKCTLHACRKMPCKKKNTVTSLSIFETNPQFVTQLVNDRIYRRQLSATGRQVIVMVFLSESAVYLKVSGHCDTRPADRM